MNFLADVLKKIERGLSINSQLTTLDAVLLSVTDRFEARNGEGEIIRNGQQLCNALGKE